MYLLFTSSEVTIRHEGPENFREEILPLEGFDLDAYLETTDEDRDADEKQFSMEMDQDYPFSPSCSSKVFLETLSLLYCEECISRHEVATSYYNFLRQTRPLY